MNINPSPPFSDQFEMRSAAPFPRQRVLLTTLVVILIAAIALGTTTWRLLNRDDRSTIRASNPGEAPPPGAAESPDIPLPPVEPVRFLDLAEDSARAINAAVPFSTAAVPPAAPFRVTMAPLDLGRAVDCLAAAAYYEAGDDVRDQQPVVQVVLNRMRHPAFPANVCAVVFQGSERSTGCQFSFTCDGSMTRRRPSEAAWQRARGVALAALGGYVFMPVGYATHYHADWVVPNWSTNVDKVARVDTHLFFRWRGSPGTPRAFRQVHAAPETQIAKMLGLSDAHGDAPPTEVVAPLVNAMTMPDEVAGSVTAPVVAAVPDRLLRGNRLISVNASRDAFIVQAGESGVNAALALVALDLCSLGQGASCTVSVYSGADTGRPAFQYLRDAARSVETVQWDCERLRRANSAQCLPGTVRP